MKAIAPASTPVLVELVDGQPTTTSLDVSAHFGKRHADVIRAISKLDCSAEFTERNFALSDYTDSTGRKLTQYRLTRDGFTFLCMGFTGKEAAKWKEAYINAFNEMERALSGAAANPDADAGPSEPAEPIHLTYNDRPFRIVPEGAALWFVAIDVARALDMRDAYCITRHLRSEHKAQRQIGHRRLSLIDRRGLDLALHYASLARSEPLRLWLDAALEQFVTGAAPRALLGGLSGEQQGALKALVAARIETLPEAQRGKAATRCWSALKAKFGCGYKEIEPEQFTEAVSLVARIVLEGEWLGKEESKEGTFVLDEYAAQDLNSLIHYTDWVQHRWNKNIRAGLKALNPELYKNTWELFDEAARAAERLERRVPHIMAAFRSAMRPRDYLAQGMSL